jgi:RNA polymerase sigma factor (sigma-70 family)
MIDMNTGSRDGVVKQPFRPIETQLQTVVGTWRSGSGFNDQSEQEALADIYNRMERIAASMFSKWRFRNSEDDARDVVQEWFVRMWRKGLKAYDCERLMCNYAYTVFRRICYSRGREEGRRMRCLEVDLPSESESSDEMAMANEVRNDNEAAMKLLTPKCRDALRRLYWGEQTREDTSESDATMQKKIHGRAARGRSRLRPLLAKHAKDNTQD